MVTKAPNTNLATTIPGQAGAPPIELTAVGEASPRLGARIVVVAAYAGAALLSFTLPLAIYVVSRRARSPFVARHAAQALNAAITTLLYGACSAIVGALLMADSPHFGIQVAITGALFFWLLGLGYLIPPCLCAGFAR